MTAEQDPDPNLREAASSAFALGWNVREIAAVLANTAQGGGGAAQGGPSSLPLFNDLTREEQLDHLVRRVRARIGKVQAALTDESSAELKDAWSKSKFPDEPDSEQLSALHTTTLGVLMAEDSRLGKAYSLGLTLWQISASPDQTWDEAEQFNRARHYLADLHTVLPDHAAMGVLGSLLLWKAHAEEFSRKEAETLPEQGRTWRALLSGEKSATNDLSLSDYVAAGQRALENGRTIVGRILNSLFLKEGGRGPSKEPNKGWRSQWDLVRRFGRLVFKRPRWALVGLTLVVGVGVVAVLLASLKGNGGAAVGGGAVALGGVAGGLGFAKKAWDSLGGVWDNVRPALMDAALDLMIAVAITQLPKKIDTDELRSEVEELLHPSGLAPRQPPRDQAQVRPGRPVKRPDRRAGRGPFGLRVPSVLRRT